MMIQDPLPQHHTIAIFGLGASGIAAANLLAKFNKKIIASDTADDSRRAEFENKLPPNTTLILGKNDFADATIIVTSPGLEPSSEIFKEAANRGIPVLAELDLAFLATRTPIVAISGTDGKTTTTTLTSHILNACGVKNVMGGNVGIPLCTSVCDPNNLDCLVVETSAFQLSFCPNFRPHILIATNIAEDHAEYFHNDWDAYISTKRRPLNVMNDHDIAILNASDKHISRWNMYAISKCVWYAEKQTDIPPLAENYAYADQNNIIVMFNRQKHVLDMNSTHLRGHHNAMNTMCSLLAALYMGCNWDEAVASIASYKLPPHRIQTVCEHNGVTFIDDSKATNPHAAIAGLNTGDAPLVLIAGGVDKGLDLAKWIELMKKNVRALVLIGDLTERLYSEAMQHGLTCPVVRSGTLQEAVKTSYDLALNHDATFVLLSPACSSYDMFKNYNQRGDVFANAANSLD